MWALATARIGGQETPCLQVDGRLHPLGTRAPGGEALPGSVAEILANWPRHEGTLATLAATIGKDGGVEAELLAPILYPGKVLCAGANYYDHMAEMGFPGVKKEMQRLFFFMKPPRNAVVGPGATVLMPRGTKKFDWDLLPARALDRAGLVLPGSAAHQAQALREWRGQAG
jgi:2-keto-4-pentenoate hydratase/2-oxohepta-3-ene-1,7-dioic acid hydratase in catechol pathway